MLVQHWCQSALLSLYPQPCGAPREEVPWRGLQELLMPHSCDQTSQLSKSPVLLLLLLLNSNSC